MWQGATPSFTRRQLLRAGGGGALALGALGPLGKALAQPGGPRIRQPDSLPDPWRPAGEPTNALPFDHLVILMMENHSFDCYFGMLPKLGQPQADGFSFDAQGQPSNRNPLGGGYVVPYRATSVCQGSVTQN
jgi:phospholipase C